ncbi:MAG: hypothetical protein ACREYE_16875 [Gammaproteobacteria bacterium]
MPRTSSWAKRLIPPTLGGLAARQAHGQAVRVSPTTKSTADGIKYNVRTPLNYDPTLAHPLLMVYAPVKRTRMSSERFTNLTREATRAGFVVVYADHRRLSPSAIIELGTIPRLVVQKWCIDENASS